MLVNDPDSLKSWLVVVLEPLCDADSSALARYVLALLKKDKPMKELKKIMIEQLDVFLSVETKPFVEKLFNAINSGEYMIKEYALSQGTNSEFIDPIEIKTEDLMDHNTGETKAIDIASINAYISKDKTPPLDEGKAEIKSEDAFAFANGFKENTVGLSETQQFGITTHLMCSESPAVKIIAEKENQPREFRRRRSSFRSRSRSQSQSNERISRRSRSRDRRPTEKTQRQFRNKSPPPAADCRHVVNERRRGGIGGTDRRRNMSNGGGGGVGSSDDRSPRFSGSGGEGRRGRSNRSNSRSSRSPSADRNARIKCSPTNSRTVRTSPDRHHIIAQHENEKRQRCRDFDEKGYCVRGETCPWDHGVNPVVFEGINNSALISMSLREYNPDAPDLWSRGGAAVADNPIVVSGTAVGITPTAAAGINPFTGTARTGALMVGVAPGGGVSHFPPPPPHIAAVGGDKLQNSSAVVSNEYSRTPIGAFRGAAPMIPFPFNPAAVTTPLQRELIPIPVVDAGTAGGDVSAIQQCNKRRFELEDSVAIAEGPTKRKLPLNSRLGPRILNMQNNCSLELRKVPRGLNTIAHLNNHFAKFGKIINIQVSYEGDPEAAIVTFSTHAEANVAYRSTEAVLNNRFIKVFWHNQDHAMGGGVVSHTLIKDENMLAAPGCGNRKSSSHYHVNNIPAIPTPTYDSAKISNPASSSQMNITNTTVLNHSAVTTPAAPGLLTVTPENNTAASNGAAAVVAASHVPSTSLRMKNNIQRGTTSNASNAIIRKKQEEQAKAVVQLANGLRKRKQELLASYVKQMKTALELVERCDPNDPQRAKTFATIKCFQETIDKLRKDIAADQELIQAQIQNQQPPPKKTKEQQKKELLDIELELFAQQQEGNDTSSIQKRLEELQRSLGIIPGNSASSPTGSLPGANKSHFAGNRASMRGRSTFPEVSTRVDRRPTNIVVTGFTKDEAEFVLGHFKHFGEITKHELDKEIPQLMMSYATRLSAEQAVLRGKVFKDKRLHVSWAPTQATLSAATACPLPIKQEVVKGDEAAQVANVSDIDATDTIPELRLEDEEEEEESEDRSWRR